MKNLAILLALTSTAVLSAVACGDSDSTPADKGGGGSSGSTGTGGSTATGGSAGTPATGGSSGSATGGSATGGSATGGSATGGMSGTAGSDGGVGAEAGSGDGGVGAEGGGGPGPGKGCPASEPMGMMNMCDTRGLSCEFGNRTCRCNLNTGNWQCFDTNGDCPAMPDPGGDCMGGQTACSYGDAGTCVCIMGNFTCDTGVVSCPATQPMDGAGCNMFPAGFDCPYSAGDCTCQGGGGLGGMRTWNCQSSACPAMAPMANSACTMRGLICEYTTPGPAADPTCVCNDMDRWTCL